MTHVIIEPSLTNKFELKEAERFCGILLNVKFQNPNFKSMSNIK